MKIPENFEPTVEAFDPQLTSFKKNVSSRAYSVEVGLFVRDGINSVADYNSCRIGVGVVLVVVVV